MPSCPRCGKYLMTDQGLYYHLNKKFKCNSWICKGCNLNCTAKYRLQAHVLNCRQMFQSKPKKCDFDMNKDPTKDKFWACKKQFNKPATKFTNAVININRTV